MAWQSLLRIMDHQLFLLLILCSLAESGLLPEPTSSPTMPVYLACDFEREGCELSQVTGLDQTNWIRGRGSTPSEETGPDGDHTTGTGNYMFIEASSMDTGSTAMLLTPVITEPGEKCVMLAYHMYGMDMGSLLIYKRYKTNGDFTAMESIFEIAGNKGSQWHTISRTLQDERGQVQFIIKGVIGKSYLSDIAIDDIKIHKGPCGEMPTPPTRDPQIPAAVLVNCTFENLAQCKMFQVHDGTDDFDWTHKSGATLSVPTGPDTDHTTEGTTKKGYYMYTEASNREPGQKAILASTAVRGQSGVMCLELWYHMFGMDIGTLRVLVASVQTDRLIGEPVRLWSMAGNQGNEWKKLQKTIYSTRPGLTHQIAIEAERGPGYLGDIAIDDVLITDEPCPGDVRPTGPTIMPSRPTMMPTLIPPICDPGALAGCTLNCMYGYEMDYNHCPLCKCLEPCKDVKCPIGKICLPAAHEVTKHCRQKSYCADPMEVCTLQKEVGTCSDKLDRYYYNRINRRCEPFEYYGCNGNANNFMVYSDCQRLCGGMPYKKPAPLCMMPLDRGTCDEEVTRWYFNAASGLCEAFDYGGCGGNKNQFESRLQCQSKCQGAHCLTPAGKSLCPPSANIMKWRYNPDTLQCEYVQSTCSDSVSEFPDRITCEGQCKGVLPFACDDSVMKRCTTRCPYGFDRDEEGCHICRCKPNPCENVPCPRGQKCKIMNIMCPRPPCDMAAVCIDAQKLCMLPMSRGPCPRQEKRYYYDFLKGKCEMFTYGGCHGNMNNFHTEMECSRMCEGSVPSRFMKCFMPKQSGECDTPSMEWYHDMHTGKCKPFVFNGCKGNENQFRDRRQCEYQCATAVCHLPPDPGMCMEDQRPENLLRWHYNPDQKLCDTFRYTGCQGSGNNFVNKMECEQRCKDVVPPVCGPVCEISCPYGMELDKFGCPMCLCKTPCKKDTCAPGQICRLLQPQCNSPPCNPQTICIDKEEVCSLPPSAGSCDSPNDIPQGPMTRFFYNAETKKCEEFRYSGCKGNNNNFLTMEECMKMCYHEDMGKCPEMEGPLSVCAMSPGYGPCRETEMRWTFNTTTGICQEIRSCKLYGNNFGTEMQCKMACRKAKCILPRDEGFCSFNLRRYSYNLETRSCEEFTFGGCGGNANNFISRTNCTMECLEVDKPKCAPTCALDCPHGRETDKYGCPLCMCKRNVCVPGICGNGGTCYSGRETFYCACLPGYTGKTCGEMIPVPTPCPGVTDTPTELAALECNFENTCKWRQVTGTTQVLNFPLEDNLDWELNTGPTQTGDTGPPSDHTTGEGKYIYLEASSPATAGQIAMYLSPLLQGGKEFCLSFYYHMHGAGSGPSSTMGTLSLESHFEMAGRLASTDLWSLSGEQGDEWKQAMVTVTVLTPMPYHLVIKGVRGADIRSDMAVDDIHIENMGPCPGVTTGTMTTPFMTSTAPTGAPPVTIGDLACDFERLDCKWIQVQPGNKFFGREVIDQVDWIRNRGDTNSANTGPKGDHTSGIGNYMFLESSEPSVPNDKAMLASEVLRQGNVCMTMFYHMFGPDIGELKVVQIDQQAQERVLWTKSGNQGDMWREANIFVPEVVTPSNNPLLYRIVIVGTVDGGYQGDIAIDDISFVDGVCPGQSTLVPPSTAVTIPTMTTPTPVLPLPQLGCTFETTECTWNNVEEGTRVFGTTVNDNINWIRKKVSGEAPQFAVFQTGYGPSFDHTKTDGHLMYVQVTDPVVPGDKAWFISELLNEGDVCMKIFYLLSGSALGELNVFQIYRNGVIVLNKLWNKSGDQGNVWKEARIDIPNVRGMALFRMIVEGVVYAGYNGMMAIDDITFHKGPCTSVSLNLDCNFEVSCPWKQVQPGVTLFGDPISDEQNWEIGKVTPSADTGPTTDHTTGSGNFLFIETSDPVAEGDRARYLSELVPQGPLCLSWWYHMYGSDIGSLKVHKIYKTGVLRYRLVWEKSGNQDNKWIYGQISLPVMEEEQPFHLLFEAVKGPGYMGDISIDDIMGYSGQCPEPTDTPTQPSTTPSLQQPVGLDCNFEDLLSCNWTQVHPEFTLFGQPLTDKWDWILKTGTTQSEGTGPTTDHTTGTGNYVYLETSDPSKQNEKAKLVSTQAIYQGTYCLSFAYHMYGINIQSLKVYKVYFFTQLMTSMLWQLSGNQGDRWNVEDVEVTDFNCATGCYLMFEAEVGDGYQGDIAIDDVIVRSGRCMPRTTATTMMSTQTTAVVTLPPTLPPNLAALACDFEQNIVGCQWRQVEGEVMAFGKNLVDQINWKENTGVTQSGNTGPSGDHTTGSGKYIFIEASNPSTWRDKAWLASPLLNQGGVCMTFYYHMYGAEIGHVAVYKIEEATINQPEELWKMMGNRGNQWLRAQVNIPTIPSGRGPYHILIEGMVGTSYRGDAAIDDITFSAGACPGTVVTSPTASTTIPTTIITTPASLPVNSLICDFEEIVACRWVQLSSGEKLHGVPVTDQIDWLLQSGPTETAGTGPEVDHTLGTGAGKYMYVEASDPSRPGDKALMASGVLTDGNICMTLWYYMHGQNVGTLKVHQVYHTGADLKYDQLWTLSGGQGNFWRQAEVYLPSLEGRRYQVVIEGIIGTWYLADIAIDDINIIQGRCPSQTTTERTTERTTTPPVDGTVAPGASLLQCTFEVNQECSLVNVVDGSDQFDWFIGTATPSSGTGADADHTTGSGRFLFLETTSTGTDPRVEGDTARLKTSGLLPNTQMCLVFWYYMLGNHIGNLSVSTGEAVNPTPQELLWKISGEQGPQWIKAYVDLPASSTPYSVLISGVRGNGFRGDISVDDVSITTGSCHDFRNEITCGFESTLCFLHQKATDKFDWTFASGATPTQDTGPIRDHSASGFYVYIEATSRNPGDVAVLETRSIPSGIRCLSMYYHMYGANLGSLAVIEPGKNNDEPLWISSGPSENAWKFMEVEVGEEQLSYKVQIHGTVGSGSLGDIAIDDLKLTPGRCVP